MQFRPNVKQIKIPIKEAFQRHLQRKYSLRLHMIAILLATTLSGILFSKVLLLIHVMDFRIRYPVAVVLSYLVFFACIKLWLSWIASIKESRASVSDWLDFPLPSFRDGAGKVLPPLYGGGGQFSGAGAAASFDTSDTLIAEASGLPEPSPTPGSGSSEGIGDAVGEVAGALGDDNIIVAVIVLAVLVATILVSTVLVLYSAPAILAEAAFQGVLAASLIKRTRVISDEAWAGSILKATWKPFALTLGVTFVGGAVLHSYYPQAVRLADILWKK